MTTFANLARKSVLAVALLAGLSFTAGAAKACNYYYKNVTTYVTVQRPVAYYITRFDDCGHAYQVRVVDYQPVRVPVTTLVKYYY